MSEAELLTVRKAGETKNIKPRAEMEKRNRSNVLLCGEARGDGGLVWYLGLGSSSVAWEATEEAVLDSTVAWTSKIDFGVSLNVGVSRPLGRLIFKWPIIWVVLSTSIIYLSIHA